MSPASVTNDPYCARMVLGSDVDDEWPRAGHLLLAELSARHGRYALITRTPEGEALAAQLTTDLGLELVHLGAAIADFDTPPDEKAITSACAGAAVLTDIDALMWPALGVPAIPFLARRARRQPTIAVWPGVITDGRARYSAHGRPDYHDERLRDVLVLHARTTRFPDEVPYRIERVAP